MVEKLCMMEEPGEKLISDVFVGVAFYQKLHHLVNDKIHAAARGLLYKY